MDKLVSLIVTSYNHAEYLEERLNSLLGQTYKNIEIIVIDDGSQDASADILKRYKHFSNIKSVFLKENKGYANASNLGVELSRAEYIMFAEADDFNAPNQIEVLMDNAVKSDAGVVYSRSYIVNSKGKVIGDDYRLCEIDFRRHCLKDRLVEGRKMGRLFLNSCVIPNMSAALIKKDVFKRVGGFSEKYKMTADWDFWCRMTTECDFFYVTKPLNYFRTHEATLRKTIRLSLQIEEVFDLLKDAFSKMNANFFRRQLFKFNMGIILAHMIICNRVKDMRNVAQLVKKGMEYEKFIGLYLLFGVIKKIFIILYTKFCRMHMKYEAGSPEK